MSLAHVLHIYIYISFIHISCKWKLYVFFASHTNKSCIYNKVMIQVYWNTWKLLKWCRIYRIDNYTTTTYHKLFWYCETFKPGPKFCCILYWVLFHLVLFCLCLIICEFYLSLLGLLRYVWNSVFHCISWSCQLSQLLSY